MKNYAGDRTIDGISVQVDGRPLPPYCEQLRLTDHGFEWSYEGPEPGQLAFALLFDHLRDAAAAKDLHHTFMERVVANFGNDWEMTAADLDEAIKAVQRSRAA